jgi:hypothetical protein
MSYVSHITSFVVKVATIYSACVEERAIVPVMVYLTNHKEDTS